MSARDITSKAKPQASQADDSLDIPESLKISAERRKQAWLEFDAHCPSKPAPAFGREMTETELAYRRSIEHDRALKRAADEVRFRAMRTKAAAEKAEREAVRHAVEQRRREEGRGVDRDRHAGAGAGARRAGRA